MKHFLCLNHFVWKPYPDTLNIIDGVMVSVLASSAVDRAFESRSGQTKEYQICMCCFSAKHSALRRKSKDWLARNQDNVSKWGEISNRRLSLQWASTIKIQLSLWSSTKRTSSSFHWKLKFVFAHKNICLLPSHKL
jgi:hypothetical protein